MNRQIVREFVDAINAHDVERILFLMADDHVFIDAYGSEEDKEAMKRGWPGYFRWFPDYHIEVQTMLESGGTVAIFGFAGGTYQGKRTETGENTWRLPAAWKAVVEKDKIKVWQVFCDSKVPYEIINRGQGLNPDL